MYVLWLISTLFLGLAVAQWDPYTMHNRQVLVHLFEWRWVDIAAECERWLGPHGFAGVQVSPPNQHLELPPERPWFERYQPIGYALHSRSGSPAEFKDMVSRCYKAGVRIYVDAVINHMAASNPGGKDAWDFGLVPYSALDFNWPQGRCPTSGDIDYSNIDSIRNCDLVGLKDLNVEKSYVQDKLAEYLNVLVDAGVAGFRIDAAKHMWPGDLDAVLKKVKNLNTAFGFPPNARPFIFQEVINQGGEVISSWEYRHLGRVTEFKYGTEVSLGFRGDKVLSHFDSFGEAWGFLPETAAVVFIDNHDNQRGHGGGGNIISHKAGRLYKMANAFMLAHPYGIVRVMSSFSFNDPDSSPPRDPQGNTLSPVINPDDTCGNGWVCEHRWRQIKNMVDFRNVVVGQPLTNWWDNGNHMIAFGRGDKGFIVINNEHGNLYETLQTGLPQGTYCNIYLGDFVHGMCTGPSVFVDYQGFATFNIQGGGNEDPVVALHIRSKY
ncbi:alpha-amylase 1-like [Asterias amurensis]|uniref:alpha-amylase 1-like n=1 Tax=Asterias amurensis TaxID=7602 RepID=UPI003AB13A4D